MSEVNGISSGAIDEGKFSAFLDRMLDDVGATISATLVRIGDRLGFYRVLDAQGPSTAAELAERTLTEERYVREWCANQASTGYLTYDCATGRFALPPEHALVLARDESPYNLQGLYAIAQTLMTDEAKISEAFRDGSTVGRHRHSQQLFGATAHFFRPGYATNITAAWIPALDGIEKRLREGIDVADVACGYGISTMIMARAYPKSRFIGYDYNSRSIEEARMLASDEGLSERIRFEVAPADAFPGTYDFVTLFDALHEMGNPVGAMLDIRRVLRPNGSVMIVEPFASDRLEDDVNPAGRTSNRTLTMLRPPSARSQPQRDALHAGAGEARIHAIATEAGFTTFRRAAETLFNVVYEVKP
jgi:SAM-dependent methyltransferase